SATNAKIIPVSRKYAFRLTNRIIPNLRVADTVSYRQRHHLAGRLRLAHQLRCLVRDPIPSFQQHRVRYSAKGVCSSFSSNRFLIGESLLGKLSETVVLHGNAPHDRPCSLVSHLIDNRASFLCTRAPMLRVPDKFSGWHQISGCSCVTCVDCEWPVVLLVET